MEVLDSVFNSFSPFDIQEEQLIIIKCFDPLIKSKENIHEKEVGPYHGFGY